MLNKDAAGYGGRMMWAKERGFSGPENFQPLPAPTMYIPTNYIRNFSNGVRVPYSIRQNLAPLPGWQSRETQQAKADIAIPALRTPKIQRNHVQQAARLAPVRSSPSPAAEQATFGHCSIAGLVPHKPVPKAPTPVVEPKKKKEIQFGGHFHDPDHVDHYEAPPEPEDDGKLVYMENPAIQRARAERDRKILLRGQYYLPPAIPSCNPFKAVDHPVDLKISRQIREVFKEINQTNGRTISLKATSLSNALQRSRKGAVEENAIRVEDIPLFMEKMGQPFSNEDLAWALKYMQEIDVDGDGQVELPVVTKAWPTLKQHMDNRMASQFPKEIIQEINELRSNPPKYADKLRARRKYYTGKKYQAPEDKDPTLTQEGLVAVDSAISFLMQIPPLDLSEEEAGLMIIAEQMAVDMGRTGGISHTDSNGAGPLIRLDTVAEFDDIPGAEMRECFAFAARTAEDVIIQMLVDDGVSSRGHRRNLVDEDMTHVGVGTSSHPSYGTVVVVDLGSREIKWKPAEELPNRPYRPTITTGLASRAESEAAKKLQMFVKRRTAMKLRQGLINDEKIIKGGTGTVLSCGYKLPMTPEFRKALGRLPWKLQQMIDKALKKKMTKARITTTPQFIQVKTWGEGVDRIVTLDKNAIKSVL